MTHETEMLSVLSAEQQKALCLSPPFFVFFCINLRCAEGLINDCHQSKEATAQQRMCCTNGWAAWARRQEALETPAEEIAEPPQLPRQAGSPCSLWCRSVHWPTAFEVWHWAATSSRPLSLQPQYAFWALPDSSLTLPSWATKPSAVLVVFQGGCRYCCFHWPGKIHYKKPGFLLLWR